MRLLVFNPATDADDPLLGFTTRWLAALATRVERIYVLTMRAGRLAVPDNVRVCSVGKERGYGEPRRALEFYRQLFHILRQDRIGVCFSHMIPIFTILGAPVLRAKRVPIVTWHAHRQVTPSLRLAHHLSARVVTSAETAYRYKHDRLVVVGQGIDTAFFSPDGTDPDDPPLLLSVGRLSPIKDPMTLVAAVHLLRQRDIRLRCAFVGDAPPRDRQYADAVRRRATELGLEDAVTFVGAVGGEDVVHWYRRCAAHVNLCPTGAPDKAALEAMACGRPSFVANEGFAEILGPWTEWLLFRHGDSADLAAKVERLLHRSQEGRQRLGADLRLRTMERHDLDRLATRLVAVFAEVSGG